MKRKIVEIDEAKCIGCGLCANACHEGAIAMVDGKAKLVKDDYCDGMGDCLPECPAGAIKIVEREAAAYDAEAVEKLKVEKLKGVESAMAKPKLTESQSPSAQHVVLPGGCPGKAMRQFNRAEENGRAVAPRPPLRRAEGCPPYQCGTATPNSQLSQWPCQIRLVPATAPFFKGAKLLIAADCTAYAYANFHQEFMRGKVTIVGCPKLDPVDYSEKLTEILRENDIKSVTIVRMEVPCCGGLEMAAKKALQASGKFIPWQVVTLSLDGKIIDS
ncbi:MAG: 4Fe-4S binding protein [Kiritimatiellae bacterium]|nr:4Fe-4S binding protein [Kiritimatiellia bacterium]